jgi:hypothetical protein
MRSAAAMISAIRTMATQAPAVNFVTPAMMNTMPDSTAPVALKTRLFRQCGWSRCRRQCATMPAWAKVKARNTPTAYSGSKVFVLPLNTA